MTKVMRGPLRVIHADVMDGLRSLGDGEARCVVTSPPYFGLRDYGVAGQIGLEATPEAYVARLVEVFREVWRVLADDGTLWLNLGDCYANDGKWGGSTGGKHCSDLHGGAGPGRQKRVTGLKPKDLVGIPWRVAFALQADGWWLRSDIIWSKPNGMPESVQDRPTRAHEYIFLLSKSRMYYYDAVAIREKPKQNWRVRDDRVGGTSYRERGQHSEGGVAKQDKQRGHGRRHAGFNERWDKMSREEQMERGSNKRDVWTVATSPYPEAHFATFPPKLIEPCILAGSEPGDVVLDPFFGAGTTGMVALRHGRRCVGIELNEKYVAMARRRIESDAPLLNQTGR